MKCIRLFLFTLIVLLGNGIVESKSITICSFGDFLTAKYKSGDILIVKKAIDLDGNTINLPSHVHMSFRGCGCFKNGNVNGNNTSMKPTEENVFQNCTITGTWHMKYVNSTMFDVNMDAMMLFRNMSHLSRNLQLSDNRTYNIDAKGEEIEAESLIGVGKRKPHIEFHTTDPNVDGIKLSGKNIRIENLKITDDYDVRNDEVYGENQFTIGNTIAVKSPNRTVENLVIKDCDFYGGTSSSYIASSQVQNCSVQGCTFSGYMADHAIYCSMKAITFKIEDCEVKNVLNTKGLFKIRSSKDIKSFVIKDVKAHNLNGYMANIFLLKTPTAKLLFDNITVTKDFGNTSIFYGFCISDEKHNLSCKNYNAKELVVRNCSFGSGYLGNCFIYSGSGMPSHFKRIKYVNVKAKESNFGGGIADNIKVCNCFFEDCCTSDGIAIQAKKLSIEDSIILDNKGGIYNCLFLINYYDLELYSISLKNVDVCMNIKNLLLAVKGKVNEMIVKDCVLPVGKNNFIYPYASAKILRCNFDKND